MQELSRRQATEWFADSIQPNPDQLLQREQGHDANLYQRILDDDQCKSAFEQRRMSVVRSELIVDPASESAADKAAADFMREQLEALPWDDKCEMMLYGLWNGHAVGECLWGTDGRLITLDNIKVRPARRFRYGIDFNRDESAGLYETTRAQPQGELRPERKYWTFCAGALDDENPYGIGLGHYCWWPAWFKRQNLKFWLVFLERFGQPTVKATTPEGWLRDPVRKRELGELLQSVQSDSWVAVPDGVVIELLEATRGASADYLGLRTAMDKAIAKIILSQTLTIDADGGQYKADIQKGVRDEVIKGDADLLMASFNRQVVRWLTEWNFPGAKPPRVWRNTAPPEDLNKRAERDGKIKQLGYSPTEDYIENTYGEGWEKNETPELAPGDVPQGTRLPANFAEAAFVLARKAQNRRDQDDIAREAISFANAYTDLVGERREQLLEFLEEADDLTTFRQKLRELQAEPPPSRAAEKLARSGFAARLLGALRNQR